MIPFQLFYDITSVKIKYEEGFANVLGHIFTKPELMWTKADQNLVIPTEYSLCIGFSLQTGTLVLLQCFWNYLANSVAKASFMSSKEFMFYIFWTFTSFIIFPVLQYNFSRDIYEPTYKEIMPEMVYGIELFIVGCLGVVSHFRFKKLLNSSRDTTNGRSIIQKIRYFQEVNKVLSTVLFGHGTLLTILSCDGLTGKKTLNAHKFSADFFICNINMCAVITWFCMILIFHPKHNTNPNGSAGDEDAYGDGHTPLNNNSGISSTYGQATTLVIGNSQASSDCMSYSKGSIHPLSKSGNCPNYDSGFHFGPLPIPPDNNSPDFNNRNNTSFSSTAPSMTTLVSQSAANYGSQGKGRSKGYNHLDYYEVPLTVDDTSIMATPLQPTPSKQSHLHSEKIQRPQVSVESIPKNNNYASPNDEYIPPPLSPARKGREISTITQTRSELARRKYSHSMTPSSCNEDMSDFGASPYPMPDVTDLSEKTQYQMMNGSMEGIPGIGDQVDDYHHHSMSYKKTSSFQPQRYHDDAMLSSFRDFGPPPISPLLTMDGEMAKYQSYSKQSSSSTLQSFGVKEDANSRKFDLLPPPPSSLPPPPL
ncbi:hypothetical protein BCV72DRAFT_306225 [Rhizopus microsporus var. microsporus]|nr:hypothetical protein BCV72DRAFT_306225 [Rhizopus microsporus var. microsporus]